MNTGQKLPDEQKIDLYLAVLAREDHLLKQLVETQRDKRPMIVLARPGELDQLNQKEGALVSDLEKTEGARFKLQKSLAASMNMEAEAFTAQALYIILAESQPARASRLQELTASIQRSVGLIQEASQENHQLLDTALEYIAEMQWMLTGEEGAGTYSQDAAADPQMPPPRRKIIDAKA